MTGQPTMLSWPSRSLFLQRLKRLMLDQKGFFDAVIILLRNNVEQSVALEELDLILLCLDEVVDGGIVLETDGSGIAGKVAAHNMEDEASLSEQTTSQALATAREHFTRSLLR